MALKQQIVTQFLLVFETSDGHTPEPLDSRVDFIQVNGTWSNLVERDLNFRKCLDCQGIKSSSCDKV